MKDTKKSLKFAPELMPLILSGNKDCTWRLWDDKHFRVGDLIVLIARPDLKVFGEAEIVEVINKTIGELTNEDKRGHEPFYSDAEMYATYEKYYGKHIDFSTPVTIYRFKLISSISGSRT